MLCSLVVVAGCHDDLPLDNTEQVLESLEVKLSAERVVLTPGNRAVLRIDLIRDDPSVPINLVAFGSDDVKVTLSAQEVTQKPATLTVEAVPKAGAQDVIVKLQASTNGATVTTEVLVDVQVPTAPIAGVEQYAPGVTGEPRTFVLDGVEMEAEVINGLAIAHGDMILGEVNALEAYGALKSATCNWHFHTDFNCSPWSGGVIGYSFADNWGSDAENTRMRGIIQQAIDEWELQTGLRFALRNYGEYLQFRDGDGCSSTVGRAVITGFDSQSISLNNTGCDTKGIAMHEIGHALGLYHEQCRNDRDSNVVVDFGRVQDGKLHNFFQWGEALRDRGPYDFGSIMHYGRDAFARNGAACRSGNLAECTIRPIDPAVSIGQRSVLSEGDILGAYMLYPPEYRIVGAVDGATDDRFFLGLDFTTEAPRADRMVWRSNRVAAQLGTGNTLTLRASDVPSGTHVITASLEINTVTVISRSITLNLGNTAPVVTLAATNGRTNQDLGHYFTMAATVSDAEDGACGVPPCRYSWTPAPTSGATNQRTAVYRFDTVGSRTITVRVEDNGGGVTTRSATMNIVNTAPVAQIIRPSSAIAVPVGATVPLEGRATDLNSGTLACSALRWRSSNTGDVFSSTSGCTSTVRLAPAGTRTISLVATDALGAPSAAATVSITAASCTGTCGPTAFTTLPPPDWNYGGLPVYFRESTVPVRLSIGHTLAPANSPISYRFTARRIGTTTTLTIASGTVTVTSPSSPVNVNVNWAVGTGIPSWSLCDNPSSYRNYELVLEATDTAGTRTTQPPITVKVGCALI